MEKERQPAIVTLRLPASVKQNKEAQVTKKRDSEQTEWRKTPSKTTKKRGSDLHLREKKGAVRNPPLAT